MREIKLMTKQQKNAISRLNAALKNAHKCNVMLCGMDGDLLYATKQAIEKYKKDGNKDVYCDVANCNVYSNEGSGKLYSECYEDSGGY